MEKRDKQNSYIELSIMRLHSAILFYKAPIISSIIIAVFTYMFVMTNKIINFDDARFLFGKGYTLTSGRWGLDILQYVLPNYSMPWLWGTVSILILTVSICFIIKIFHIKNVILQCILAAAIIAFPSEIGTMLYMFTSSSYAIAFLCAVSGVYLFVQQNNKKKIIAVILTIFSLSIYQAYISITASFLVLLLIQNLLSKSYNSKEIIKKGIEYVLFLVVSLAIYYGITLVILKIDGQTFNSWATRATSDSNGIAYRSLRAWKLFAGSILFKAYGLETTDLSQIMHIIAVLVSGIVSVLIVLKQKNTITFILYVFLVIMCFPLSVYSVVVIIGENGIHPLTLYSFISVYIFAVIVIEMIPVTEKICFICYDIITVCLSLVIISNVYIANKAYLKQYLVCENTYSFYETIMTQVQMTPGFDENCKLAVVGRVKSDSSYLDNFGEDVIYGLNGFKSSEISDTILHYYLGFDIEFASNEELEELRATSEFKNMATYPYYGYVQKIDNFIVVKLEASTD